MDYLPANDEQRAERVEAIRIFVEEQIPASVKKYGETGPQVRQMRAIVAEIRRALARYDAGERRSENPAARVQGENSQ